MAIAHGPRPNGDPLPILAEDVELLTRRGMTIAVPAEVMTGLLEPFNGRARAILVRLLAGHSKGMACAGAGVPRGTFEGWCKADSAFAQAVTTAHDLGFSATIEAEVYDRAMDREDRASGRLLEMIAKARSPEYREKSQLQLEVVRRVESAGQAAIAGWSETDSAGGT